MNDLLELLVFDLPFVRVDDRVSFHKSDGDMHVYTREDDGTVIALNGREEITVRWDNGQEEVVHENDLVLV